MISALLFLIFMPLSVLLKCNLRLTWKTFERWQLIKGQRAFLVVFIAASFSVDLGLQLGKNTVPTRVLESRLLLYFLCLCRRFWCDRSVSDWLGGSFSGGNIKGQRACLAVLSAFLHCPDENVLVSICYLNAWILTPINGYIKGLGLFKHTLSDGSSEWYREKNNNKNRQINY